MQTAGGPERRVRLVWLFVFVAWTTATVVSPIAFILASFWFSEYAPFELLQARRGLLSTGLLGVALLLLGASIYAMRPRQ